MRMADPHLNVHCILAQGRVRIQRARVFAQLGFRNLLVVALCGCNIRWYGLVGPGLTVRLE